MNERGLSLTDIGPATEDVIIGTRAITVSGISARAMFALGQRYPEMRKWLSGEMFDFAALVQGTPDMMAAIIAAGTGKLGDVEQEVAADRLGIEDQLDILEAIGRLTFKNGFGPFVNRVTALAVAAASVSPGKGSDTKSPQGSTPSSGAGTPSMPSGA